MRLVGEIAARKAEKAALREEIARLKGLKGRPKIRPSGMETATDPKPEGGNGEKRRRGGAKREVSEERVITVVPPPDSRFKGYESYVVEDLVVRPATIRYRRERWRTAGGETIVAPLPAGVRGHFGPGLRRYVLALYHQGRMTVAGLLAHLDGLGVSLSKRQLVRLLIAGQETFVDEARDVLGAGHTDYLINDAALAYMRPGARARALRTAKWDMRVSKADVALVSETARPTALSA